MEKFSILNLVYYTLFTFLVFHHQHMGKNFKGSSVAFQTIITAIGFLGMVIQYGFLIYYGITVVWWAPFIVFFIGLVAKFPLNFIEIVIDQLYLVFLGFVLIPLFGYLMFTTIPM